MSNPFYSGDSHDVDDDDFLNHPRSGSSGYMLQNSQNIGSISASNQYPSSGVHREALGLDTEGNRESGINRAQALMQKRREIEERTLDSSNRSLGLLFESERAGAATAEELNRQKEQLKRTEERLDDINSTLKTSERHLQGIKSVFGGIKNYFSSKNASAVAVSGGSTQTRTSNISGAPNGNLGSNTAPNNPYNSNRSNGLDDDVFDYQIPHHLNSKANNTRFRRFKTMTPSLEEFLSLEKQCDENKDEIDRLDDIRSQNHPGLRTRGLQENNSKTVDEVLNSNLDEMSLGLGRLKGLAVNLNEELGEHNAILDRLDDKTSGADWRVKKQNKDMDKLLNPKKK